MPKKSKENKQLLQLGQKSRAGRIISEYIRAIGTERTERVDIEISVDEIKPAIVSKAERLAREIWQAAFEEEDKRVKLDYRKLILERIEGKSGEVTEKDLQHPGANVPDRVSEIGKQRLNKMAKGKK